MVGLETSFWGHTPWQLIQLKEVENYNEINVVLGKWCGTNEFTIILVFEYYIDNSWVLNKD